MASSEHIIDVSEADFEYEVLAYSATVPVVVDFWADWCIPCRTLGPLLEKLTQEAQGAFRLARLDVDANPNLARRFGIRSIPAVKAFRDGQLIAEFTGARSEPQVRQFLAQLAPDESALLVEKGDSLLILAEPAQAEAAYLEALELSPTSEIAALGLARSLLQQGRANEARLILHAITQPRQFAAAESLAPLVEALIKLENHDLNDLLDSDNPLDASYIRSLRLVSRGNLPAALDGLLEVLRQDKRYRAGLAHKVILSLLELMGEQHPDTRAYRAELAQTLF